MREENATVTIAYRVNNHHLSTDRPYDLKAKEKLGLTCVRFVLGKVGGTLA